MFVVRVTEPGGQSDHRAFTRRVDAQAHFDAHFSRTFFDEEIESVMIFEVPSEEDATAAIIAVTSGDQPQVRLLKKIEPASVVASKTDWEHL